MVISRFVVGGKSSRVVVMGDGRGRGEGVDLRGWVMPRWVGVVVRVRVAVWIRGRVWGEIVKMGGGGVDVDVVDGVEF